MERLTYRSPRFNNPVSNGACEKIKCSAKCDSCKINDLIAKLCAYEDSGLEPEEIKVHEAAKYNAGYYHGDEDRCRWIEKELGPIDHLRDLLHAEQDGRLVVHKASLGEQVWIIERDDCGDPYEISGYMFLASTGNAVIVTSYINSLEDLEETLGYHIQETAENYETDLAVFPEEDCYLTREEAEAALKGGEG